MTLSWSGAVSTQQLDSLFLCYLYTMVRVESRTQNEDNILAIWHLHLGCKVNKCFTEDIIVQILMYKRSPTCTVYWWSIKVCSLLLNSAIDWFGFWSSLSKSLCISCRVSLCLSHFLPVVVGLFLSIWSRLFTSEIALPLRISCIMLYYIIIRIHN